MEQKIECEKTQSTQCVYIHDDYTFKAGLVQEKHTKLTYIWATVLRRVLVLTNQKGTGLPSRA